MNNRKAVQQYDKYLAIRNREEFSPLTREVFQEYGIDSFHDLARHLRKYGEYGGLADLPCCNEPVLLPFHHDLLNKWLRFDNPRVEEIYDRVFYFLKDQYPDKQSFNRSFFHIEESILRNCWCMPMMDTRILEAPITGCWDKMEIQAAFLKSIGFIVKRFCFHSGMVLRGHTFVLYNDGKYWKACLDCPIPIRNKNLDKLCYLIFSVLKFIPFLTNGEKYELVEFESPYEGMPSSEYLRLIEDGVVLISQKNRRK